MITVLSPFRSPRLEYVLNFVFDRFFEQPYTLESHGASVTPNDFVVAYGCELPAGVPGIRLHNAGLCRNDALRRNLPKVEEREGLPLLFAAGPSTDFPCDVFSLAFFVLSRYEEYLVNGRDQHGRFRATDSVFAPFLDRPFLDRWLLKFENLLVEKGAWPQPLPRHTKWSNTIDVDIAYAFRGRQFVRRWGGALKDLVKGDLHRVNMRREVLKGRRPDPFDTYDYILQTAAAASEHRFFFLAGAPSEYDINLDVEHPDMQNLIERVAGTAEVGLHPSYRSGEEPDLIAHEKRKLEAVLGEEITDSRQHFLRMKLPLTYRRLEGAGIRRDFSMGYHDRIGFRSGTAYSHPFYDIEAETELRLRIVPLHAMDSALRMYMDIEPEAALRAMTALYEATADTGGTFTTVWHNHSLAELWGWEGWCEVYQGFADFVWRNRENG